MMGHTKTVCSWRCCNLLNILSFVVSLSLVLALLLDLFAQMCVQTEGDDGLIFTFRVLFCNMINIIGLSFLFKRAGKRWALNKSHTWRVLLAQECLVKEQIYQKYGRHVAVSSHLHQNDGHFTIVCSVKWSWSIGFMLILLPAQLWAADNHTVSPLF